MVFVKNAVISSRDLSLIYIYSIRGESNKTCKANLSGISVYIFKACTSSFIINAHRKTHTVKSFAKNTPGQSCM